MEIIIFLFLSFMMNGDLSQTDIIGENFSIVNKALGIERPVSNPDVLLIRKDKGDKKVFISRFNFDDSGFKFAENFSVNADFPEKNIWMIDKNRIFYYLYKVKDKNAVNQGDSLIYMGRYVIDENKELEPGFLKEENMFMSLEDIKLSEDGKWFYYSDYIFTCACSIDSIGKTIVLKERKREKGKPENDYLSNVPMYHFSGNIRFSPTSKYLSFFTILDFFLAGNDIDRDRPELRIFDIAEERLIKSIKMGKNRTSQKIHVWSSTGDKILFLMIQDKIESRKIASFEINTGEITVIGELPEKSHLTGMDWKSDTIAVSTKEEIYLSRDGKNDLEKLVLKDKIDKIKSVKVSPDGNRILFSGRLKENDYLFVYDFDSDKLFKHQILDLGTSFNSFVFDWFEAGRVKVINEFDYQWPLRL